MRLKAGLEGDVRLGGNKLSQILVKELIRGAVSCPRLSLGLDRLPLRVPTTYDVGREERLQGTFTFLLRSCFTFGDTRRNHDP